MNRYLFVLLLAVWGQSYGQSAYQQPDIDVLFYHFSLTLSDASDQIRGETRIRFNRRTDQTNPIWFDLAGPASGTTTTGMRVTGVSTADGKDVAFSHRQNRVFLTLAGQPNIPQEVLIRYEGVPEKGLIISKNKFGDRTFFGDNWPNNARHWLPVVDHPSDKATCDFMVTAPARYRVIANGKLVAEHVMPNGQKLTHWHEGTPIPTKVMVIGAAQFAVEEVGNVAGIPVQSWLYPRDSTKGFIDYKPARAMLQFFIDKIGPYAYEKLANVESTTMFGGMENASCIFYNEKAIVGRKDINMEALLAHEIAHQWFGNSASEADWPHVWLSEGFATYFSALYLEHAYGRDTLNRILNTNKGQVFRFAGLRPNGTIVDSTATDLISLLNPNSYQKGGWVLHMLRHEVGDEVFWQGIRAYYARYRDSNARTAGFQQIMEKTAGRSLDTFFRQWLYQPGYPDLSWRWRYDAAGKTLVISVTQQQPAATTFTLPLVFSLQDGVNRDLARSVRVVLDKRQQEFTIPLAQKPVLVVLDPDNTVLMKAVQAK